MSDFVNLLSSSVEIELAKTLKANEIVSFQPYAFVWQAVFMWDGRMQNWQEYRYRKAVK